MIKRSDFLNNQCCVVLAVCLVVKLCTLMLKDEGTNQNVKRALRKYVNEQHNDWDVHLPAVVYGINTAEQVVVAFFCQERVN